MRFGTLDLKQFAGGRMGWKNGGVVVPTPSPRACPRRVSSQVHYFDKPGGQKIELNVQYVPSLPALLLHGAPMRDASL